MAELYKEIRPWGNFKILFEHKDYKVKELVVNPGEILSLQSHKYRNEHWIVLQGQATAHLNGADYILNKDMQLYIPKDAKHRLSNLSKGIVRIIEVQTGTYFGEDDITRYEDVYKRV